LKIIITAREALDKGIWDALCDLKGIKVWAINEGMMDDTEEITLTEEEAETLGLIQGIPELSPGADFADGRKRPGDHIE